MNKMIILGIYDGHNASAALLIDGKIIGAVQEERFSRIKNDYCFPKKSIEWLLRNNCLDPKDISNVIMCSNHVPYPVNREKRKEEYKKNSSFLYRNKFRIYNNIAFLRNYYRNVRKNDRIKSLINFGFSKKQISFVDHHQLHAETVYYSSGFFDEPVLIFTSDGSGDDLSGTVSIGENGKIKRIKSIPKKDSIGTFYAMITYYLGMIPLEHEYKVMGLAPYTSTTGLKYGKEIFKNLYSVKNGDLQWSRGNRMPIPQHSYKFFKKLLENVRFDIVAAASQYLVEEITSRWIRNVIIETGIRNVLYSGGVVMNVKANKRIWELDEVNHFWAMPSGGDDSLPLGACYGEYYRQTNNIDEIIPFENLYLGPEYDESEFITKIDERKFNFEKMNKNASSIIANYLDQGEIIAIASGRVEFGARALGNRSILADPSNPKNIPVINNMIKGRDFWMPFAISILDNFEDRYIYNPKKVNTEYMINTFDSVKENVEEITCGIHQYDKTTRPQIVRKSINPEYYEILEKFKNKTGIGAVMNTSFNLHGYPIVLTPEDAFYVFENSGLKYLQVGNYMISKKII